MDVHELIKQYQGEVGVTASNFYIWRDINNMAAEDSATHGALNRYALTWNRLVHALQTTFFTALGRVFDNDPRSLTVFLFIEKCRKRPAEFGKAAIEQDRIKGNHGVRPDWLEGFLEEVSAPNDEDFDALVAAILPWQKIYEERYKPIRNKLIAHKDFASIGFADALFKETNMGEVEEMLQALHQIGGAVQCWYQNGRTAPLTSFKLSEDQYVRADLERLFAKLKA